MKHSMATQITILVLMMVSLTACSTSTIIDEFRETSLDLELSDSEQVVVMGRRHAGEYETEPDFIDCIGNRLANGGKVSVMPEQQFLDSFYPWFEPRVAPLKLKRMGMMLNDPLIAERINGLSIRYLIWVDGHTETTEKNGTVSCALTPGGAGCFGFATWDKTASYEATVWDLKQLDEEGRVKVSTEGSSYVLAVVAPIPFIAQVQGAACVGIGDRLKSFFNHVEPDVADRSKRN